MRGIVWFREDLRILDNNALYFAGKQCIDGIVALYIIDLNFFSKHSIAACRVEFILRGLVKLSEDLAELNISLQIVEINNTQQVITVIQQLAQKIGAEAVFFNRQYEIDEVHRDIELEKALATVQIKCFSYDDQIILPINVVKTQQESFYQRFTPYCRTWRKKFLELSPMKLLSPPKMRPQILLTPSRVPEQIMNYRSSISEKFWPAGEKKARQRLRKFIKQNLHSYLQRRDFPAINATSRLSPYLTAGMISARECFLAALRANGEQLDAGSDGAVGWMSELIWREFYKNILVQFPRVSMGKAFHLQTDRLPWQDNPDLFQAWASGQTGIPIIDAAMRQLNTTGWMHNRLRMVVASFLAKNLQLNWRMGEKYFMEHLIDGDLAANNGGWQWCASTGVDAVPYFRVFNPYAQSMKFDQGGEFIRQYCPELKKLQGKQIHRPPLSMIKNYPAPIVDIENSRKQFIANFKKIV